MFPWFKVLVCLVWRVCNEELVVLERCVSYARACVCMCEEEYICGEMFWYGLL